MFNLSSLLIPKIRKNKKVIITFTGGMGAQILSAAIYFSMRDSGNEVYADLSYFENPAELATEGQVGQISQWAWQLTPFGINPSDFKSFTNGNILKEHLIADGPDKISLALNALENDATKRYFSIQNITNSTFDLGQNDYLCAHIRRGDYINVASHLMPNEVFLNAANKFNSLCKTIVVISDSRISQELKDGFNSKFEKCIFLDSIDAITAHCIMRMASVLICSNSQFSLVAAALNTRGVVLLPKNWGDSVEIAAVINRLGNFQMLYT
ncbi:alpha-1,2-fucosyltransferase [Polynucleobacter sp. 78F-HAINBA]|uniref:alpha-1,2-fucosyltransferase n=1 Tax=Polynucleobacter sp. 78F-HAINBA TaxID=2689099 RepID=UPI001C0E7C33|nr:alpha-1,2-fucosyltransferase [Polynucleobacter sp. 78F-HAINBA]MBU3590691.1 alpha-1,2-fucosyltransferase [Polynucleobacter sp. 78F-HAINBA]